MLNFFLRSCWNFGVENDIGIERWRWMGVRCACDIIRIAALRCLSNNPNQIHFHLISCVLHTLHNIELSSQIILFYRILNITENKLTKARRRVSHIFPVSFYHSHFPLSLLLIYDMITIFAWYYYKMVCSLFNLIWKWICTQSIHVISSSS